MVQMELPRHAVSTRQPLLPRGCARPGDGAQYGKFFRTKFDSQMKMSTLVTLKVRVRCSPRRSYCLRYARDGRDSNLK